jgi:hypothetical protein
MNALLLALLFWLSGRRRGTRVVETRATEPLPAGATTPPWPQVVPAGVPAFPGGGWQYDEPPPLAVQQRAGALVSALWSGGVGTYKIEQTGGRWIAYRAEIVASGKHGVVAYRLKPTSSTSSAARAVSTPASTPAAVPKAAPAVAPASTMQLPLLQFGAGLKPGQPSRDVRLLQQRLGIAADGRFGADTRTKVRAFQAQHGLEVDGKVGPATWAALFSSTPA